nr:retrotransposon protein, putative, Ty3-gypsy subclass [Tanacetum cinerariifolium]
MTLSDGENTTLSTWLLISLTRCNRSGVLLAIFLVVVVAAAVVVTTTSPVRSMTVVMMTVAPVSTLLREEHEDHLRTVLQTLRQEKLYAKFSKCEFWLSSVALLGHIVSEEGITLDPAKVEAITKWPRPTSVTERRWLELLKDYNTNIQYHPGKANVVADALSRKAGMIASIKIEEEIIRDLERLDIELYIKEAQKEDSEIWAIVENLDKQDEFCLDEDNVLWQDARLVVPNDASLREALLAEAHSSPFLYFWWSGMKRDVATFVARCLICQQVKIEHQQASGLCTAFHPQTNGQSERTIQTLEDMLRSCALEWTGNWDDYICLVEFAYNNSWHASIKCAHFEMLYGPEMIKVTNAKVAVAKEKLKEARTRQKSYADKHRRSLEFPTGDHVFLKVSPARGVRRF